MRFQLDITLTEEDYLAYNIFHALESLQGKKQLRKRRIFYISITLIVLACALLLVGWTPFSIALIVVLGLYTVLYLLLLKKMISSNIKAHIKQLKKAGKLPIDPVSTIEFYEDKMVDASPGKRSEQSYTVLERICVVKNRFVLLYNSSISANILPFSQIQAQLEQEEFLRFLSEKCNCIEYY